MDDELEVVEGVRIDRGYLSPHFVTDTDRMEVALDDPLFLITDQKLSSPTDIVATMEMVIAEGRRPLVVIAEDVDGEALATLVVNKMRGTLGCVAIKAPGFGERRKALLEDMAVLTGSTVISSDVGLRLDSVEMSHLGSARRMVAMKDDSTIIDGRGSEDAVKDRAEQLKVQIEETTSDYDREKLEERLASLVGGVAVIKIGGATEPEVNERKSRAEDALAATKAAVEEGIVPGGGVAMVRAESAVEKLESTLSGEEALGARLPSRRTPVQRSIPNGRTLRTASAAFSGRIPPARNTGRETSSTILLLSDQSCTRPVPPSSLTVAWGRPESSSRASTRGARAFASVRASGPVTWITWTIFTAGTARRRAR